MVGRIDTHHHAKFSRSWSIQIRHIAIFQIFRMSAASSILDFKIAKFIGHLGGEGRDASARQISLKSVNWLWRYWDFSFFKMAAATILDCQIREILIADAVWKSRPITVTFFYELSFRYGDIALFSNF